MYYDRKVSDTLLEQLLPGGRFASLGHLARTTYLVDLQLRGYPHGDTCWATLYCGLTKFLDLHELKGLFWIDAAKVYKEREPEPPWKFRMPAKEWKGHWSLVEKYLRLQIKAVADRFTLEGAVQAMLCTDSSDLFSVVDREAVVGFKNDPTKSRICAELQGPLASAFVPVTDVEPWCKAPRFGTELDVLAVDDEGRLLVIEVKPGSSVKGITWAPLQVSFYARLFERWIKTVGREQAASIIDGMLAQKVELGLTRVPARRLRVPFEVVPVVAIGGDVNKEALRRMRMVQQALLNFGSGSEELEVWNVWPGVRRTSLTPT
jgi:hypothetical protein